MIKKEEVYKIGLFNKPHGIHGELQFTFTDDIFDRVDCDYLVCLLDGIFVPFFIEEYRFRSDSTALVKLEGVDTAERARTFTNVEVYFPVKYAEEAGDGELSWNFFVGFRMEDTRHGLLARWWRWIPLPSIPFSLSRKTVRNCWFPPKRNLS